MGARGYVPTIGRFLSVDPVLEGSANPYDYCNADPINNLDLPGTAQTWYPHIKFAWDYLTTHGLGDRTAAAIIGNLMVEATPRIEAYPSGNATHIGIAQWSETRWKGVQNGTGSKHPTFKQQLAYLVTNFKHRYKNLWADMIGQTPEVQAVYFDKGTSTTSGYERCSCSDSERSHDAHIVYMHFHRG
jgi:hypothetical protein